MASEHACAAFEQLFRTPKWASGTPAQALPGAPVAPEHACAAIPSAQAAPEQDTPQNPFALLSKEASSARIQAYQSALETIKTDCDGLEASLEKAQALERSHPALDRVVMMASAFKSSLDGFTAMMSAEEANQAGQALGVAKQLEAIGAEVNREHDALEDAPGREDDLALNSELVALNQRRRAVGHERL